MHLFYFLPVLSLLLRARASSFDSREPAPHRLDVRDTSDVCAIVSGNIPYTFKGHEEHSPIRGVCICLSNVDRFLDSLAKTSLEGAVIPEPLAEQTLTNLITTSPSARTCDYPDNSVPFCDHANVCAYTCQVGFSLCNGLCVAGTLCPSSQAISQKKRSWVASRSCTDMGLGWVACGVLGAGPRAWECVNADRDLESCGGCTFPLTAYSPIGEDCSALPGVADVSCLGGECVVHRCLPGHMLAFDGRSCIRTHHLSQSKSADPEDVPARVYGLEHVPLGRN